MELFTISSVLFIMAVCIVTVKLVIPRLTLHNVLSGFWKLICKPFKRNVEKVQTEWNEVKTEE